MKRSTIAAIATAAVLVIGGGTAYALTSNGDEPAPVETVTSTTAPTDTTTPEATAESEPIVAESPAPPVAANDPEAAYLIEVHARLARIQTQIPNVTDEQLLAAAYEACEILAPNQTGEDLSLIEGEERSPHGYYQDSSAIIVSARITICPIPR
ncbi:hypothetical protein [Microbacterium sp. YJN-G]|uniref:hypothetical protein n=1 Tax=Microbacterium sp. YJN-G TaxID=2763257 RepID=UPI001877D8A3|nr:hypothetical protein [Microbacterium sp. YJN-G]